MCFDRWEGLPLKRRERFYIHKKIVQVVCCNRTTHLRAKQIPKGHRKETLIYFATSIYHLFLNEMQEKADTEKNPQNQPNKKTKHISSSALHVQNISARIPYCGEHPAHLVQKWNQLLLPPLYTEKVICKRTQADQTDWSALTQTLPSPNRWKQWENSLQIVAWILTVDCSTNPAEGDSCFSLPGIVGSNLHVSYQESNRSETSRPAR